MRAAVTIREERDPVFWQAVADHPKVRHVTHGHVIDMGAIVEQAAVVPLASAHGGFIFTKRDPFGTVFELHTMFTPEGWRREAHDAAVAAFVEMFGVRHAALIFTYETEHLQSRVPRSFGFERSNSAAPTSIGDVTPCWLTSRAWFASPAWRRACQ